MQLILNKLKMGAFSTVHLHIYLFFNMGIWSKGFYKFRYCQIATARQIKLCWASEHSSEMYEALLRK